MKKNILMLAVVTLFAVTGAQAQKTTKASAKTTTTAAAATKVAGPGMVFDNETIDYGTIAHKSNGAREFVLVNNGTEPLIIKSASGSCGCTVPTWPKEPIMPGQKATIGVSYDTNRTGSFQKTVSLTTNIGEEKKVLTIKGNVLGESGATKS